MGKGRHLQFNPCVNVCAAKAGYKVTSRLSSFHVSQCHRRAGGQVTQLTLPLLPRGGQLSCKTTNPAPVAAQ